MTLEELILLDYQIRLVIGGAALLVLICCLIWMAIRDRMR